MSKENIKTILLCLLVSLSLILTWGLWTYQPKYDYVQNPKFIQNVVIGKERSESELITPTQIVFHRNNQHFGTMDQRKIKDILKQVSDWEFSNLKDVDSSLNRDEMNKKLKIDESVEFIYSVSIPSQVLTRLYSFNDEDLDLKSVSRILISMDKDETPVVYFLSMAEEKIISATIPESSFKSINEVFKKNKRLPSLYAFEIGNGNVLFLPEQPILIEQLTYSTQRILASQFKNALFSDPGLVKQYSSNNGEESYTDGARALEVFLAQNKMRYINPTPETFNMSPDDFIMNSIEYINNHAGWTDDYLFFNWNSFNQSTSFRLVVGGYPVFDQGSTLEIATIDQSWRNHEIYEYTRSLINLSIPIGNQSQQIQLPSGKQLMDYVSNEKANFDPSLLKRVMIGYEVSNENQNTIFLSFKPAWFIQYNGVWEKVNVPGQGGNVIGLE